MSDFNFHYMKHQAEMSGKSGLNNEILELQKQMESLGMMKKEKKTTIDETNCMFCAMHTRNPQVLKNFFLNWHKVATNSDILLTPLSSLTIQLASCGSENLQYFVEIECINAFIELMTSKIRYSPFYCVRNINVLTRDRPGLVFLKLLDQKSERLSVQVLVKKLIQVMYEQFTLEKRECLLIFANICQFIISEDALDEDFYVEKVYNLAQELKSYLLEFGLFKAFVHCLKLMNGTQFRAEIGDCENMDEMENLPKDLYYKYGNDYVDATKFNNGVHQEDCLSRAQCYIGRTPFEQAAMTDFHRSLAKSIYKFSRVKFNKSKAVPHFSESASEFWTLALQLLKNTTDYATQCYLMGALCSFDQNGYFKEMAPQMIWNHLKGLPLFNESKMKDRDSKVGWKTKCGILPEAGWLANTRWVQLNGELEPEYHEFDLRLEHFSKNLRQMVSRVVSNEDIEREEEEHAKQAATLNKETLQEVDQPKKTFHSSSLKKSTNITSRTLGSSSPLCEGCGKQASKRCSQCHSAYFCSAECMKKCWPEHKKTCVKKQ
ncbi:hypothetical protein C9374_011752 [Naegleria lovaniensis]|uniref:MYND-type domain-containing protein n=1 Tax=Naegleria lovaniensis TaxID=51637 RepID=A0AA88KIF5_NAELO|nr:uncharacterized protein C9374_011752 [Naegleria lovaniensis]KAG2373867.1 hypothetical protein C9374_011752 [Naegleria lovaniensis]